MIVSVFCLSMQRQAWPDRVLDRLAEMLREHSVQPALSVILGARLARQGIPATLALPTFVQSYLANLVTAAVRLIPLGQTDGRLAVAELEDSVLAASAQAKNTTIDDLDSAAFMVGLASIVLKTQYTRLFGS
jgi:urease accessory protein